MPVREDVLSNSSRRASLTTAPPGTPVRLLFDSSISQVTQLRMKYAFRVFAAVYNHRVVDNSDQEAHAFVYGPVCPVGFKNSRAIWIPARYSESPASDLASNSSLVRYADEDFCLFHGVDPTTKRPDWLGEIFEWLSSSRERGTSQRDSVGRIPDSQMTSSRSGLPPWNPQACLLMAWLENFSRNDGKGESLPKAPSPIAEADHLVVCSHDVDFYFTNRRTALQRLIKNLGIACLTYKSWSYFRSNLSMIWKLLVGERIGDYFPRLLDRLEQLGFRSTLFMVPAHAHRRDPNYSLDALRPQIQSALARGFPVELHSSYTSIIENHAVAAEARVLENFTGRKTYGSRQHWLRFGDPGMLFQAVEDADLFFDSSMGFNDLVGFRNGACFAFPPYDFKKERAHNFLEIPLAIMDGSLIESSRTNGEAPQSIAERVLNESRKHGWGGISILWHNPLEPLSVPQEINQIFWHCAEDRQRLREKWVSTEEFLSICLQRYQNAGLLADVKIEM